MTGTFSKFLSGERFRMHIKTIYIFGGPPVLSIHRIQVTRLYLNYNALYYIVTIYSNKLEIALTLVYNNFHAGYM